MLILSEVAIRESICCRGSSASQVLGPEILTFECEAKEPTAGKILPWVSMVGVRA